MSNVAEPKACSGDVGNCTGRVAYIWVAPHGGLYGLCVKHCAEWREQTGGTPLAPKQIRSADGWLR